MNRNDSFWLVGISFLPALALALALTPLARKLAARVGAISTPGGRNVHVDEVPRLGGLAMAAAVYATIGGIILWGTWDPFFGANRRLQFVGIGLGSLIMCGLGAYDDVKRVAPRYKLAVQVLVAMLAYATGFRIQTVDLSMFGELSMGSFSLPITILWIVGIVNAINLVDGLDGLAGGIVLFASFSNVVVGLVTGNFLVVILMAAMAGSVVGFLFHNFSPARIFMGDSGSYFLGFVLATVSLLGSMHPTSTAVSLLVPVLALGLPIVDTLFAIVRRFLERRPLFSPDRGHIHHRLLDLGLTQRRAVLILYGASIVFTSAALLVALGKSWHVGLALIIACSVMIGLLRMPGYFGRRGAVQFRAVHGPETEFLRELIFDVRELLSSTKKDEHIIDVLDIILTRSHMARCELVDLSAKKIVTALHRAEEKGPQRLAEATFGLGSGARASHAIRFVYESESKVVSPQTEILLQLVVDELVRAMQRIGSAYGPVRDPLATPQEGVRTTRHSVPHLTN